MKGSHVLQAATLLAFSIVAAIVLWPTVWRLGWATSVLSKQMPPPGGELAAVGKYLQDAATLWWLHLNNHPPATIGDWLSVAVVSAFATLALILVISKALLMALLGAGLLGGLLGTGLARGRTDKAGRDVLVSAAGLLKSLSRWWLAELLIAVAGVVALDAVVLALNVHG